MSTRCFDAASTEHFGHTKSSSTTILMVNCSPYTLYESMSWSSKFCTVQPSKEARYLIPQRLTKLRSEFRVCPSNLFTEGLRMVPFFAFQSVLNQTSTACRGINLRLRTATLTCIRLGCPRISAMQCSTLESALRT